MGLFCSHCGSAVTDDSKFCFKCGKDISRGAEPVDYAAERHSGLAFRAPPSASVSQSPPKLNKPNRPIWMFYVAGIFVFIMYFNIIASSFEGIQFYKSGRDMTYVLFIGGLFFWWVFKRYGRNKWIGGTFGVVLSFVVLVTGGAINNHTKGRHVNSNSAQSAFNIGECIVPRSIQNPEKIVLIISSSKTEYTFFTHYFSDGRLIQAQDNHKAAKSDIETTYVKIACPKIDGSFSPDKYLSEKKKQSQ